MAKMRPSTTPYSNERCAEDDARKYKPGRCLHMEREATGAIAVQLLKKSEINTFLSSFNTGINKDKSEINTTKI